MNIIKNIRLTFGNWFLKKKLKSVKRKKSVHSFNSAQNAGIIFNVNHLDNFEAIDQFMKYLSGKNLQVFALVYIHGKKIPDELTAKQKINFFTKKDINFYYKPKSKLVNNFIEKEFDILIDLSNENHFPLTLVNNLSKASFKVGQDNLTGRDYDLMFSLKKNQGIDFYIEQIKHYLSQINKEKTVI